MRIIRSLDELKSWRKDLGPAPLHGMQGASLGFVPTMGYLHDAHLSLVQRSMDDGWKNQLVSIFVNPKQFGENEDIERYPRDEEGDFEKLQNIGVQTVFLPTPEMFYPKGFDTHITTGELGQIGEGLSRNGHLDGVLTVLMKLLQLIQPEAMYLGQKDYQQWRIVHQMAIDYALSTQIVCCPIIRETNGVAMSSRNAYLSPDELNQAKALSNSLKFANEHLGCSIKEFYQYSEQQLDQIGAKKDYVHILDPVSLVERQPTDCIKADDIALISAYIGKKKTKLLDNHILGETWND